MAHRALLLDFDGVILRNDRVRKYVQDACSRLFAEKTRMPPRVAARVNRERYPLYGHTSILLSKEFGIPCTVQGFNKEVYDCLVKYDEVKKLLEDQDVDWIMDMSTALPLERAYIFSNAPTLWCKTLSDYLGLTGIPEDRFLCSDKLLHLKPHPRAFLGVEKHTSRNNYGGYFLVDDDPGNVSAAMNRGPTWSGHLFQDPHGTWDDVASKYIRSQK
jgi:FMN phosphatase YigB (HAD superfamily)